MEYTQEQAGPSLNSKLINQPETREIEANLSDVLPLPLPEYFKKCTITDEERTAKQAFYSLCLSEEDCSRIEYVTQDQRNSDEWYRQRQGRLTASNFHTVLSMQKQTNPITIAERLLSKCDVSHLPAVRGGINHEDVARQEYIKEMQSHISFKCTNAGLVVNPLFPHVGASPDGFIHCDCCGKGLVEIKCPYSAKDIHPNDLRGKPRSCLGENSVVRSHAYFTQIQGQLVITERQYCDLAVWTTEGITTERVFLDVRSFWTLGLLRS